MGFFSQDCGRCGHPLLSPGATTAGVNEWMTQGVAIDPEGGVHLGDYDGYGRLGGAEKAVGFGATVFHRACWDLLGKPVQFAGASVDSEDQGWFFGDGEHDLPDPRRSRA